MTKREGGDVSSSHLARLHLTGRVEAILAIRLAKKKLIIVDKTYPSFFAILTSFVRPRSSCFVAVPSSSPTTASFPSVLPQCYCPPRPCTVVAQRTTPAARADFLLCVLLLHGGKTDSDLAGAYQVEVKPDETTNFFCYTLYLSFVSSGFKRLDR